MWKYSSFWYKNFDMMAFKTVLRQLISRWGIMSIEMQDAYVKDMSVLHENGDYEYVDNPIEEANTVEEEVAKVAKEVEKSSKKEVHKLDEVE